jgi:hypothetical protein
MQTSRLQDFPVEGRLIEKDLPLSVDCVFGRVRPVSKSASSLVMAASLSLANTHLPSCARSALDQL